MPSLEPLFPIGFPHHLNRDRLLNDPVGNRIAKHGIGKDFAPVLDGKLGGHDGCKILVTDRPNAPPMIGLMAPLGGAIFSP